MKRVFKPFETATTVALSHRTSFALERCCGRSTCVQACAAPTENGAPSQWSCDETPSDRPDS